MIAFVLLPFLPNVFSFSDRPIAEVKQPLPMISLAELENDPDFYAMDSYYQRDDGPEIEWWEREANLVNSYPTFGSPVDLAYNQAGRIPNQTDALGEPYESVLWVEYRRLAFFLSPKKTQNPLIHFLAASILNHRMPYASEQCDPISVR